MRHHWKLIGHTTHASIYVDYTAHKTKIITEKYIYIHNGIYPFHDWDTRRRFNR